MVEPEVTVVPRPDAPVRELVRVDAGSFFVPLHVGQETMWSFYDWPERQLTNVSNTRVVGTTRYRGMECLNVSDIVFWGEDSNLFTRWLYRVEGDTLTFVLRETHGKDGNSVISEVDATPQPLGLKVGRSWEGHEVYRCGPEEDGVGEVYRGLVDEPPFEVRLPAGGWLCLRETWWLFGADGVGRSLAELYVADTGRSVHFRRFNGPGWRNYDQLAGNPQREHDGVTWRLWYECLPDIALRRPPRRKR